MSANSRFSAGPGLGAQLTLLCSFPVPPTAPPSRLPGQALQVSLGSWCQSWALGAAGHFLQPFFTASSCPFVPVPTLSPGFNSFSPFCVFRP